MKYRIRKETNAKGHSSYIVEICYFYFLWLDLATFDSLIGAKLCVARRTIVKSEYV